MDNLVLEYRDPLLGIILIVALIFLISFFTYSYSIYKEKNAIIKNIEAQQNINEEYYYNDNADYEYQWKNLQKIGKRHR